ncbi:MAG: TonB-dependent receptor, partial [Deltaproteobacteria bacterium]|nr:TonB-dependent receptor [Candidatus Tharpella sp.]
MHSKPFTLMQFTLGLIFVLLGSQFCLGGDNTAPAATTELEQMVVKAQSIGSTRQTSDPLFSWNGLTSDGLKLAGSGGFTSIHQALSQLPGLNPELTDPSGIGSAEMRLRGIKSMFTSLAVEGIPNYGIMSVGPRDYIYDLENMAEINLYHGATPAALSSGTGNRGGSIAINYARPTDNFALQLKQDLGSNSLTRSFFRLDSGTLPSMSKFFLSGSYTKADKWKGAGQVGGRDHITLGVSQKFTDNLDAELFYNYNNVEQDLYKDLDYDQARHISHHHNDDYLENLTGTPADIDYYKFHHRNCRNHDTTITLNYHPTANHSFSLKPYFSTEDKKWLDGNTDKYVESERYGAKFEYVGDWSGAQISTG